MTCRAVSAVLILGCVGLDCLNGLGPPPGGSGTPPGKAAPVADAGADIVEDGTQVGMTQLDGRASYDPDGGELTYSWKIGETWESSDPAPSVMLPAGVTTILLTVEDDEGETASDEIVVTRSGPQAGLWEHTLDGAEPEILRFVVAQDAQGFYVEFLYSEKDARCVASGGAGYWPWEHDGTMCEGTRIEGTLWECSDKLSGDQPFTVEWEIQFLPAETGEPVWTSAQFTSRNPSLQLGQCKYWVWAGSISP